MATPVGVSWQVETGLRGRRDEGKLSETRGDGRSVAFSEEEEEEEERRHATRKGREREREGERVLERERGR